MNPVAHCEASAQELPVTRVGQYDLLREIGRGGMATLHLGRHMQLGTLVAVKRMLPSLAGAAVAAARFRNEATLTASIHHPNVARALHFDIDHGLPYLVLDFLEGESLCSRLTSAVRLGAGECADLFLGILAGVAAIHAAGVVHRDLKPQNLFIRRSRSGREDAIVIDFGVAKRIGDGELQRIGDAFTSTGATIGTAGYMAPEQILNAKGAGLMADQYSLGVAMYQCLTAKRPFFGTSAYELMHATLNVRPEPPSKLADGVPRELDEVVMRAMSRDPGERFPSVHALGDALLPFAGRGARLAWLDDTRRSSPPETDGPRSGDTLPERPSGFDVTPPESDGRRPATAFFGGAVLGLVMAACLGALWLRSQDPPAPMMLPPGSACPQPSPVETSAVVCSVSPALAPAQTASTPPSQPTAVPLRRPKARDGYTGPRGTFGAPIVE